MHWLMEGQIDNKGPNLIWKVIELRDAAVRTDNARELKFVNARFIHSCFIWFDFFSMIAGWLFCGDFHCGKR